MEEEEPEQAEQYGELEEEQAAPARTALVVVQQQQRTGTDGTADGSKKKGKRKKALPPIRINLSNCKYEVLRIVQRKLGWREVGDEEDWEVYWTDTSIGIERIMKLSKTQKINHFHGMLELCRKRSMARNLQKIQKMFPEHYDFFPRTFILPGDMQELVNDVKARGKKQIYILKPDAGCQGKGIRLMQGGKEEVLQKVLKEMDTLNIVAQHYLPKPFLINGFKFDLRIYALVLSCDPLRVFVFKEGLARICTEKYTKPKASNLSISYMHLTNYAVNKHNEHFVANQGSPDDAENASKLGLEQLAEYITEQGHDWEKVWGSIHELIVKSLISVQPVLRNNYRSAVPIDNDGFSCFEVLGYDVMLDEELRPWLIECNHSSSFNIDSPLDLAIKEALITDTFGLVRVDPKLIALAKKAEKKAAAGRLLVQRGKRGAAAPAAAEATGATGTSAAAAATAGPKAPQGGVSEPAEQQAAGEGEKGVGNGVAAAAAGAGGVAVAEALFRPKTVEELEAWRSEILRKREKYEEGHLGGYTRIFPSSDPQLQSLYEELLRGSAEIFSGGFASKAKKALDALTEERKKKEEEESESVKAERAKAKAHRDRLAQQAVERRRLKALFQAGQAQGQGAPGQVPGGPTADWLLGRGGGGAEGAAEEEEDGEEEEEEQEEDLKAEYTSVEWALGSCGDGIPFSALHNDPTNTNTSGPSGPAPFRAARPPSPRASSSGGAGGQERRAPGHQLPAGVQRCSTPNTAAPHHAQPNAPAPSPPPPPPAGGGAAAAGNAGVGPLLGFTRSSGVFSYASASTTPDHGSPAGGHNSNNHNSGSGGGTRGRQQQYDFAPHLLLASGSPPISPHIRLSTHPSAQQPPPGGGSSNSSASGAAGAAAAAAAASAAAAHSQHSVRVTPAPEPNLVLLGSNIASGAGGGGGGLQSSGASAAAAASASPLRAGMPGAPGAPGGGGGRVHSPLAGNNRRVGGGVGGGGGGGAAAGSASGAASASLLSKLQPACASEGGPAAAGAAAGAEPGAGAWAGGGAGAWQWQWAPPGEPPPGSGGVHCPPASGAVSGSGRVPAAAAGAAVPAAAAATAAAAHAGHQRAASAQPAQQQQRQGGQDGGAGAAAAAGGAGPLGAAAGVTELLGADWGAAEGAHSCGQQQPAAWDSSERESGGSGEQGDDATAQQRAGASDAAQATYSEAQQHLLLLQQQQQRLARGSGGGGGGGGGGPPPSPRYTDNPALTTRPAVLVAGRAAGSQALRPSASTRRSSFSLASQRRVLRSAPSSLTCLPGGAKAAGTLLLDGSSSGQQQLPVLYSALEPLSILSGTGDVSVSGSGRVSSTQQQQQQRQQGGHLPPRGPAPGAGGGGPGLNGGLGLHSLLQHRGGLRHAPHVHHAGPGGLMEGEGLEAVRPTSVSAAGGRSSGRAAGGSVFGSGTRQRHESSPSGGSSVGSPVSYGGAAATATAAASFVALDLDSMHRGRAFSRHLAGKGREGGGGGGGGGGAATAALEAALRARGSSGGAAGAVGGTPGAAALQGEGYGLAAQAMMAVQAAPRSVGQGTGAAAIGQAPVAGGQGSSARPPSAAVPAAAAAAAAVEALAELGSLGTPRGKPGDMSGAPLLVTGLKVNKNLIWSTSAGYALQPSMPS